MEKHRIRSNHELRVKIHDIIFEADTGPGKFFDVVLLIFILGSILAVMLETVPGNAENYKDLFLIIEWVFTGFFTIEYILRLYSALKPVKYATSFYGIVDLLAILPTYISIFVAGTQSLMVIRAIRLLRVFRIFKMVNFVVEGQVISDALRHSRDKILVFLFSILMGVIIMGSLMYLVEGGVNEKFDSIPRSVYWAIVTLTTVGYGDISPVTNLGQFIAACVMIMGYSIIAVPTGIVTSAMVRSRKEANTKTCRNCLKEGHEEDALFCKYCGHGFEQKNPT